MSKENEKRIMSILNCTESEAHKILDDYMKLFNYKTIFISDSGLMYPEEYLKLSYGCKVDCDIYLYDLHEKSYRCITNEINQCSPQCELITKGRSRGFNLVMCSDKNEVLEESIDKLNKCKIPDLKLSKEEAVELIKRRTSGYLKDNIENIKSLTDQSLIDLCKRKIIEDVDINELIDIMSEVNNRGLNIKDLNKDSIFFRKIALAGRAPTEINTKFKPLIDKILIDNNISTSKAENDNITMSKHLNDFGITIYNFRKNGDIETDVISGTPLDLIDTTIDVIDLSRKSLTEEVLNKIIDSGLIFKRDIFKQIKRILMTGNNQIDQSILFNLENLISSRTHKRIECTNKIFNINEGENAIDESWNSKNDIFYTVNSELIVGNSSTPSYYFRLDPKYYESKDIFRREFINALIAYKADITTLNWINHIDRLMIFNNCYLLSYNKKIGIFAIVEINNFKRERYIVDKEDITLFSFKNKYPILCDNGTTVKLISSINKKSKFKFKLDIDSEYTYIKPGLPKASIIVNLSKLVSMKLGFKETYSIETLLAGFGKSNLLSWEPNNWCGWLDMLVDCLESLCEFNLDSLKDNNNIKVLRSDSGKCKSVKIQSYNTDNKKLENLYLNFIVDENKNIEWNNKELLLNIIKDSSSAIFNEFVNKIIESDINTIVKYYNEYKDDLRNCRKNSAFEVYLILDIDNLRLSVENNDLESSSRPESGYETLSIELSKLDSWFDNRKCFKLIEEYR